MAQMQIDPAARETAWGALSLGVTALVFWAGAWSYPQGHDTIWAVGAATMVVVALLGARAVWHVAATRQKV